jgi:hypothetical protein
LPEVAPSWEDDAEVSLEDVASEEAVDHLRDSDVVGLGEVDSVADPDWDAEDSAGAAQDSVSMVEADFPVLAAAQAGESVCSQSRDWASAAVDSGSVKILEVLPPGSTAKYFETLRPAESASSSPALGTPRRD